MAPGPAGVASSMSPTDHATVLPALFADRHTTALFTDQPVDVALVRAAYEHARWAPTAMNNQPLRLTVVESRPARERLAAHMAEANRPKTLAAPLTVVAAFDPRWHDHMTHLAPYREGFAASVEDKTEMREVMGRTNALIQLGYLIVTLRALGLEVGPMGGFDAEGLDADLHADTGWRSLVVLNVGHAASEDAKAVNPRAGRLEFEQVSPVL